MKKLKVIKIIASSLVIISAFALNTIEANAEWKQDSNGWWYTEGNSWAIGWRKIDNNWYCFNENGYMKKGWVLDNGKWYFLDSNGAMQTGTIQVDGKTYYLGVIGDMQTGNININGETYSFTTSGEAVGNKVPQAAKVFSREGVAITTHVQSKNGEKTVEINIEGNPTTGYEWEYEINADGIIKEDSNQYKPKDPDLCGSGGIYTWKFSALKEGTTEINFKYRRSWEKEAIKTKVYICVVDKDLNIAIREK